MKIEVIAKKKKTDKRKRFKKNYRETYVYRHQML